MLFDIDNDPHETANLAAQRTEILGHALLLMDRWMSQQMKRSLRGDPFWGIIQEGGPLHANEKTKVWQEYIERLHATGRSHHADNFEKFGGRPFKTGLETSSI